MDFDSKTQITLNWLSADRVKKITTIAKKHSATKIQRLAQERAALGVMKLVITFNKFPGWFDNAKAAQVFRAEIINAGLTDSITF